MKHDFTRRQFLATSTLIAAGLGVRIGSPRPVQSAESAPKFKGTLHKALIVNRPTETELQKLKDAGFEGVEGGVISQEDAEKCRAIAEQTRNAHSLGHPRLGRV